MGTTYRLDTQTCGRCGGSGELPPFRHIMGGVCFGCGGSGKKLTRAGRRAFAEWERLRLERFTKPAGEVRVGDRFRAVGVTGGGDTYQHWATVTAAGPERDYYGEPRFVIHHTAPGGEGSYVCGLDTALRLPMTAAEKQGLLRELHGRGFKGVLREETGEPVETQGTLPLAEGSA